MSKLTKTQIYNNTVEQINALLENAKVSAKFKGELLNIIDTNMAPKSGGGTTLNPPKLNEKGEVVEAFCRYHQQYYTIDKMVMSAGKSKGYCKASISLWNKTNGEIKKLDSQAVDLMADGDFDSAQKLAKQAKDLKDNFNKPEFYDAERDWEVFNRTNKTKAKAK